MIGIHNPIETWELQIISRAIFEFIKLVNILNPRLFANKFALVIA